MAIKIRLARGGAKKRPHYRIVIADSRSPRDGKFIEKVGTYNPLLAQDDKLRVVLKAERITYWLSVGAKPSERVEKLITAGGVVIPEVCKNRAQQVPAKPKKEKAA